MKRTSSAFRQYCNLQASNLAVTATGNGARTHLFSAWRTCFIEQITGKNRIRKDHEVKTCVVFAIGLQCVECRLRCRL